MKNWAKIKTFSLMFVVISFVVTSISSANGSNGDSQPKPSTYRAYLDGRCSSLLDAKDVTKIYRAHRYKSDDLVFQYELNFPRASYVHSQRCVGSCWAEAITGLWEFRSRKAFGKPARLSSDFVVRNRILERALSSHIDGQDFLVGFGEQSLLASVKSVLHNGIVPENAYSIRFAFKDFKSIVNRIEIDINVLIAHYRWQLRKPELLEENLKSYLDQYFEGPPATFGYNGRQWSPKQFVERIAQDAKIPTKLVEISAEGLGLDPFLQIISKHMRTFQEPVIMSMPWDSSFYDSINALMTVSGFVTYLNPNELANAAVVWKTARKLSSKSSNHTFLVWDFVADPSTQQIKTLLAFNSWGKNWGRRGYFHILKSYLDRARPTALVDRSLVPPRYSPVPQGGGLIEEPQ